MLLSICSFLTCIGVDMGMTKWEYTFITFSDRFWFDHPHEVLQSLNAEGERGWKILSISVDTGNGVRYLMEREKPTVVAKEAIDAESSSTSRD
jgi:hypothetical protein